MTFTRPSIDLIMPSVINAPLRATCLLLLLAAGRLCGQSHTPSPCLFPMPGSRIVRFELTGAAFSNKVQVEVRVRDSYRKEPVHGATVVLQGRGCDSQYGKLSDADGASQFSVGPGLYGVRVQFTGLDPIDLPNRLYMEAGKSYMVELEMTPSGMPQVTAENR